MIPIEDDLTSFLVTPEHTPPRQGQSRRTLFNDVVVAAASPTMRRTPSLAGPKGQPGKQPPISSPPPGWPTPRWDRSQGIDLFICAAAVTIRAAQLENLDLTLSTSQTRVMLPTSRNSRILLENE
jgi:hypothetical protein